MKKTNVLLVILVALISVIGCKKGDTGPQGEPGIDGNANVTVYTFGTRTFSGVTNYIIPGIKSANVDSFMFVAYYNPSNEAATAWYPVPGLGSGGIYEARHLIYQSSLAPEQYSMSVRLMKPDGTGSYTTSVTFTKFRLFVIPASKIIAGGRQISSNPPVDYNDYHAVCRYYNITE